MKKKGVGAIIAWVLLLGFSIALATMVFMWTTQQTETLTEGTVEFVEGEMQCQNVMMNVKKSGNPPTCETINIYNIGYVEIDQLVIRTFNPEGSSLYPVNPELKLRPQSSQCEPPSCGLEENVVGCSGCEKIEVMPIIKISNRKVGCKDRSIVVKC